MAEPNLTSVRPEDAVAELARSYYDQHAERVEVGVYDRHMPRDQWSIRLVHHLVDDVGRFDAYDLRLSPGDALGLAEDLRAAVDCVLPPASGETSASAPTPGPRQHDFPVWREGDRIRSAAGTGYGDEVPDARIRRHVCEALAFESYQDAAFCVAVLSLRQSERRATS